MGIGAGAVLYFFGGFDGLLLLDDPFFPRSDLEAIPLSRLLAAGMVVLSMLLAIPMVLAGWGLQRQKEWARTLGMIAGAVSLLHVPLGTAVGIYALWVLTDEATELLFHRAAHEHERR